MAELIDTEPREDYSLSEYSHAMATDPKKPVPTGDHPVQTWWDKFLQGVDGKSRTMEMAKGVARGVANAGLEAVKTIGEGAAVVDRVTGLGEKLEPGFNAQFDKEGAGGVVNAATDEAAPTIEHFLGKRSDDPLAAFTESATQFMAGWAATGELKALKGLKGAAGVATGLGRGAVVDATMFDPYEAQLAELAARSPIPIAKQLGALLSVKGDDGAVVARLKRAAAGVVPAATIEGLVAASRIVRSGKALAAGTGDAGSIAKDAQTVQAVADGSHVAEGSRVVVEPETHILKSAEASAADNLSGQAAETVDHTIQVPFTDHVEAVQQAESMNAALSAKESAGHVDPLVVEKSTSDLGAFVSTRSPESLNALSEGSLDLSYHTSPEDALQIATDLSKKFAKGVRDAVESQGAVHVEQSMQMALSGLGDVPRGAIHDVMTEGLSKLEGQSTWKLATDYVMKSYQESINKLTDVVTARPHDVVAVGELRTATQNYFDLQDKFLAANSDAARGLRLGQERPKLNGEDVRFAGEGDPIQPSNAEGTAPIPGDASPMRKQLENATPEQLAALGRIFKMSGGEPRNAEAISKAAKVVLDNKPIRQALELFTNFLLSGPKTAQTVALSGGMLNVVEPIVRMVAGAGSLNRAMISEGADQLAGAFKFAKENAIVAGQALRTGRGILDPSPQTIAIDGILGKAVRIPGNAAGAAHEFGKVTGYRSWIYARSLREGRAIGLSGDALASYTDNNLRAAFSEDGVAIVPDALKYGQLTSMSTPFTPGSFGESLSKFTRNALVAKFVVPFAKISTNIFKYVWSGTPGLNLLNSGFRETIRAGGEEAAMLHARSVAMSGIYYLGYSQAVQGNVTGRGPSDPGLRSMWLKDNQPYSVRANADSPWHSYQRFEPLAKTLGIAADVHTIMSELGDKHVDAEHMLYAGGTAIINNLTSATYMKNMAEFGAVWASENPQKLQNYLQHLGGSMSVPALVSTFNTDPVYREVNGMADAIYSRLPGFSEKLDPLFSWAGEPIMKTPGTWNRNVSVSTTKDGSITPVETEMLAMKEKLAPFPKDINGIDLTDRSTYDNGSGVSPYRAFMTFLDKPKDGSQNLRDAITELVTSPEWKDMGAGADGFPGGERMVRVRRIKEQHERAALESLKDAYPKLDNQLKAVAQMKQGAMTQGEIGVQQAEKMFNTTRHP